MLKWIGTFYEICVGVFSWGSFLVAVWFLFFSLQKWKRQKKLDVGHWLLLVLSGLYAVLFLVVKIFFVTLYSLLWGTIFTLFLTVSVIWSRYEDRRDGRRWWDW